MAKKRRYPVFQFEAISTDAKTLPGGEFAEIVEATINNRRFQFIRYNRNDSDVVVVTKFSTQPVSGPMKEAVIRALKE